MGISNAMLGITLSMIVLYMVLFKHKIRLWRMVGCIAIIFTALSLVLIDDSAIMYVVFLINTLIAGVKFISEASTLTSKRRNPRAWF